MFKGACLAAAFVLAASAAAAQPKVQTTSEPAAKFAKYGTFSFVDSDVKAGGKSDKLVRERVQYLIAIQLGKKGYLPAPPGQTGDLGVHFVGTVETAQRELMTGYPGLYEYRTGDVTLGGISKMDYRKGTLVIDLFDRAEKRLLWRTTITESFAESYTEDNWKKLNGHLDTAFKKLPPRGKSETK